VTNYRIYRGTVPGGESLLTTVGNVRTYTDTGVANGLTYYYEASAVSSAAESPKSNEAAATPRGVPSAPLGLTGSAGNARVTLSWQAPASDGGSAIKNYTVYRGTSAGGETLLTSLGTVLTYVDPGLANGQTYYYEVTATNGVGEGPRSNQASTTPATVPTIPRSLAAAAGSNEVTLNWVAPVSDGGSPTTGYKVYRSTYAGAETLLSTVGAVLSYTDPGLTNGQAYYYEVSAVNAVGEGPKPNEASATPTAPPDTTSPTITITSPANNTEASSTTVTISGTAGDNVAVAKVEVSTDGATWTTASGTTAWTADVTLRVGSNTIYARVTDASGNQATTRITVVVTPPTTGVSGLPLPLIAGFGIVVVVVAAATALLVSRRRRR
jgi:titin